MYFGACTWWCRGNGRIKRDSSNRVCPIVLDNCKCGVTVTHCVVTPLSPVNGSSANKFLAPNRTMDWKIPVTFEQCNLLVGGPLISPSSLLLFKVLSRQLVYVHVYCSI